MIFNIRGTSGSGKTTLVRRIMADYPRVIKFKDPASRTKLLGYWLEKPKFPRVAVIGGYENACGGCDTITSYDRVYELVREARSHGCVVIFEGLLLSGDTRRTIELHREMPPVTVIELNTPLDECLASVNKRRRAKDPNKPDVNPKNTEAKFRCIKTSMRKLSEAGLRTVSLNREEAYQMLWSEISLIPTPWGPGALLDNGKLATAGGPAESSDFQNWHTADGHTFTTPRIVP